jgi:hypothetical protein
MSAMRLDQSTKWGELMTIDFYGRLVPIGGVVSEAMKEIARRVELRQRLEAEGVVTTDAEFIVYADRTGLTL